MVNVNQSPTLSRYKETIKQCIWLYNSVIPENDLDVAIDYSINKRLQDCDARIVNSYKRSKQEDGTYKDLIQNVTLRQLSDYIISREPIVTAYGTMFKHHGEVPNPLVDVVMGFLSDRTKYKKMMFNFPKGSEDFEKYNLLQQLSKIDANGVYG